MDLKGKAPRGTTLEEANKIIKALWDIIQQLNEKLKTNSKNSSLSPSKDKESNIKHTEARRNNPKKPGVQPGHPKHERVLLPVDKVNRVIRCCPERACVCGGRVSVEETPHRRHQQSEFPVIRPIVTEYQIYSGVCGTYRMSKQNIAHLYQDIFDFRLSMGMVCKAEKTVSHALALPVSQARFFVRSADKRFDTSSVVRLRSSS